MEPQPSAPRGLALLGAARRPAACMTRIAVIDFETTGISPAMGDRATEVAIVMMEGGRVVDRFQSLMNAGVRIPFVHHAAHRHHQRDGGRAAPAAQVMAEAGRFVGEVPMVAHNAAFDRKFWVEELARAGLDAPQPFACTVLLSRRLYPQAPSHRLGALADYHRLPRTGQAHRALADAEMAAALAGAHPGRSARTLCGARAHARAAAGAADLAARGRAEAAQRVPLRGVRTGVQSGGALRCGAPPRCRSSSPRQTSRSRPRRRP
jgi:DNA polymerase-3 subunit epsilon